MVTPTEAAAPPPGGFDASPDPLGILRFGVNGIAVFLFGWLPTKDRQLPKALGYLGQIGGALLVIMYVGTITEVIDPAERVTLIPLLLYGLIVHPLFYVWLGREFLRLPVSARVELLSRGSAASELSEWRDDLQALTGPRNMAGLPPEQFLPGLPAMCNYPMRRATCSDPWQCVSTTRSYPRTDVFFSRLLTGRTKGAIISYQH